MAKGTAPSNPAKEAPKQAKEKEKSAKELKDNYKDKAAEVSPAKRGSPSSS